MLDWAEVEPAVDADFADADADRIVVVDTSQPSRAGVPKTLPEDWHRSGTVLNIDHHFTNTCFGEVDWIVDDASSTSELVYLLLRAMGLPIDPVSASLLYAGMYTDTGGFSLPNTNAKALHTAADLVELGASPSDIAARLDRSLGPAQFDLLKLIYQNTRRAADGALAYSSISHTELTQMGCDASDIDEQVNVPRSVMGISIAALLTEVHPGRVRLNLRGEHDTQVAGLAQQFGGGGHRQAAGAILACPLNEAVERVVSAAAEMLGAQTCGTTQR